jgi:glycosyltransferase involved in cell wall biosynthesis
MNKTLKVIQLIDSLNPGGAEMMAVNIANGLCTIGLDSHLCCTRKEGDLKNNLANNVGYLFLHKKRSVDFNAIKQLYVYIKRHQINTIHAHSSSFFLGTILKLMCPNITLIWHDHYGNSELLSKRSTSVLKVCSFFFDAIIAVNALLVTWSRTHLNCNNITYLENFASLNQMISPTTLLKGKNGKRIVCVANLRPQKDHLNLLMAFKKVVLKFPEWTLHCIGVDLNDTYSQSIKGFIEANNLQDQVFLYGNCSDTFHILNQSAIGVLASASEGLPVSILEYGLSKLPVVATDVGNVGAVILNKKTGLLVASKNHIELANAMCFLIENKQEAEQFGVALCTFVNEKFSKDTFLLKLKNIYLSA